MNKKEDILISELIGSMKYWIVERGSGKEVNALEKIARYDAVRGVFLKFLKERSELR